MARRTPDRRPSTPPGRGRAALLALALVALAALSAAAPAPPRQQAAAPDDALATARARTGSDRPLDERLAGWSALVRLARERSDPWEVVRARYAAAAALRRAGRFDEALAWTEEALADPETPSGHVPYLLGLAADLEVQRGDVPAAHERLDALEAGTPEDAAFDPVRLQASSLRGRLHLEGGRPALAAAFLDEELRLAEALVDRDPSRASSLRLAHADQVALGLASNDPEKVADDITAWLEDTELYPSDHPDRTALLHNLGRALAARDATGASDSTGTPDAAGARRILEEVLARSPPERLARDTVALLARLALDDGDTAAAARWLETLPAVGVEPVTLAARLARLSKSPDEELAAHRDALAAELDALVSRWLAEPARPGGAGRWHYRTDRALLAELLRLDRRLDGPEAALARLLAVQRAGTLARRLAAPAADPEALRRALPEATGALVVAPTVSGGTLVFAVDHAGLAAGETAGFHEIESARRRWLAVLRSGRRRLAEGSADEALVAEERRLARTLSEALLPEAVAERLRRWRHLVVVGLDGVGPLPIAWLPAGDEPHLGARRSVTLWPSVPVALALGERMEGRAPPPAPPDPRARDGDTPRPPDAADHDVQRPPGAGDRQAPGPPGPDDGDGDGDARGRALADARPEVLLMAGARPSAAARGRWPDLATLPLAARDAERLLAPYPESRRRLALGPDARRERLPAAGVPAPTVVQLLVHGVLDPRRERPLMLLLTGGDDDGLLSCDDVEGLGGAPVVLLTACRSAAGPERRGDAGAADMPGAWLVAGALAVVASDADLTWSDALQASHLWHAAARGEGRSVGEAVQAVRLATIGEHGPNAPFRAVPLAVIGRGDLVPFPEAAAATPPPPVPSGPPPERDGPSGPLALLADVLLLLAAVLAALGWWRLRRPDARPGSRRR